MIKKLILLLLAPLSLFGQLVLTVGSAGPTVLSWNGVGILDASTGPIVNSVSYIDGGGMRTTGSTTASGHVQVGNTLTYTYPWGTVATTYTALSNKLSISTTTTSTLAAQTIDRMNLFPIGIAFPNVVTGAPASQFNLNSPTAVLADDSSLAVVVVNDDPNFNLLTVGFRTLAGGGKRFWVITGIDSNHTLSNSFPPVDRPIAPLGTVTYNISLRFGSPGTGTFSLASDTFRAYAAKFPYSITSSNKPAVLNHPVCRLSTTSRFNPTKILNPRGWNIQPPGPDGIDVTTPSGITAFQTALLAWADNTISIAQAIGCQVVIFWDLDGQQTALAYVGTPSMVETIAPEIVGIFDTFINKFITAGFRIGFTLRPQIYSQQNSVVNVAGTAVTWVSGSLFDTAWVPNVGTDPSAPNANSIWLDSTRLAYSIVAVADNQHLTLGASAGTTTGTNLLYSQQVNDSANYTATLQAKVQYQRTRWGASNSLLDYVDTTTDGESPATIYTTSIGGAVWQSLSSTFPNMLFAPEEFSTLDYAYATGYQNAIPPYGPLVSLNAPFVYPNRGANLIRMDDTAAMNHLPELRTALLQGNILLVDGWFNSTASAAITLLYSQVGAQIRSSALH